MSARKLLLAALAAVLVAAAPAGAGSLTKAAGLDDDPNTWACAGIDLLAGLCLDSPLDWLPDAPSALDVLPGR